MNMCFPKANSRGLGRPRLNRSLSAPRSINHTSSYYTLPSLWVPSPYPAGETCIICLIGRVDNMSSIQLMAI